MVGNAALIGATEGFPPRSTAGSDPFWVSSTLGNNYRDVVLLLGRAEPTNFINNRSQHGLRM